MATDAEAWAIKKDWDSRLLLLSPNIVGVGLGAKIAGNPPNPTGELALVVLVERKLPTGEVPPAQLVPPFCDGVPTDVVELAPVEQQSVVKGGIKIEAQHQGGGMEFTTTGTLGCLARTAEQPDDKPPNVALSNYHVLFNVNETTHQANGAVNDTVVLPSCSGCCEPLIATVLRGDKDLDAAIATISAGHQVQARIHDMAVTGTLDLTPGAWPLLPPQILHAVRRGEFQVHKYGAKTDLTHGTVRCVGTSLGAGHLNSDIVIKPAGGKDFFSLKGDSGSVVYDNDSRVVALLWGGPITDTLVTPTNRESQKLTWSTPIAYVEKALKIRIATNPPVRIWRIPGDTPLATIHRDLAATATGREILDGYGRHQAEVRGLLTHNRRFVLAWHRGGGPDVVAALRALAEHRINVLPATLAGRSWPDAVRGLADTLPELVSPAFGADIRRLAALATDLGGRSHQQVLDLLDRGPTPAGAVSTADPLARSEAP